MNYAPIDEMMKAIPAYAAPGSVARWMFWKLDNSDRIMMIENGGEYVTYGSDAYNVAARSGLEVQYYTFGGLDVPTVSIGASQAHTLGTVIRLQGADIDFIE